MNKYWPFVCAFFALAHLLTYVVSSVFFDMQLYYMAVLGMIWGVLFELSMMDLKLDRLIKMVNFNADG